MAGVKGKRSRRSWALDHVLWCCKLVAWGLVAMTRRVTIERCVIGRSVIAALDHKFPWLRERYERIVGETCTDDVLLQAIHTTPASRYDEWPKIDKAKDPWDVRVAMVRAMFVDSMSEAEAEALCANQEPLQAAPPDSGIYLLHMVKPGHVHVRYKVGMTMDREVRVETIKRDMAKLGWKVFEVTFFPSNASRAEIEAAEKEIHATLALDDCKADFRAEYFENVELDTIKSHIRVAMKRHRILA